MIITGCAALRGIAQSLWPLIATLPSGVSKTRCLDEGAETNIPMNRRAVKKIPLRDQGNDAEFWRSRSPQERLFTLESIRREYHDWPDNDASDDDRPRLQRICRVLKRA